MPLYSSIEGMSLHWENDFEIEVKLENGAMCIIANSAGLISLTSHLLNLAQSNVPIGLHIHLDENNALEIGSLDLIIEKK